MEIIIYMIFLTSFLYFLSFIYARFIISYSLCEDGLKIAVFFIQLNFFRYVEIISVNLSSAPMNELEINSAGAQNSLPILSIRLVVNRNLVWFGQKKYLRSIIYPRHTFQFYNELLKRVDVTQK
jgi:hypothetical protein